jgi:SNF2 family DNA or RNA helicase
MEARATAPALRLVIVCPLSLINSAWITDITRFTSYKVKDLHRDISFDDSDIYVINYEFTRTKRKVAKLAELLRSNPCMMILDEAQALKDPKTLTTRTMHALAPLAKYRVILTGTPCCNSELDLWGQLNFVKPEYLHKSFYAFRNSYFVLSRGKQVATPVMSREAMREMLRTGFKYVITAKNREKLFERVKKIAHYAKLEDCADLPGQIFENREYDLGIDQARVYKDMKNYLIAEIKSKTITTTNALTKIGKLRQICSGSVIDGQDIRPLDQNPKLKLLMEVLDEIPKEEQVIVWCNYQFENRDITKRLRETFGEEAVVTMYGETEDKDLSIQSFKSGTRFIVANTQSMAHGHTLTSCHIQIFYSLSYSYEQYEQSLGRTYRLSQTQKCVYIHLIGKGTIEEVILKVVKNKMNEAEIVREMIQQ